MSKGYSPRINRSRKDRIWRSLTARDGTRCHWCGIVEADTLDHLLPRSRGGTWALTNLVPSCLGCNQGRADRGGYDCPADATAERIVIPGSPLLRRLGPL